MESTGLVCGYIDKPTWQGFGCRQKAVSKMNLKTPDDTTWPAHSPPGFHLLAKPSGSTCNIDCTYCFFLSKEALYPNEKNRMSQATLEAYIRQLLESHRTPTVTVAWQGGEPTLMKVDFFRRSVELVEKYRRPEQTVEHTFQTNGILLDDEWCAFFKKHNFLVGLSVDGPRELHDTYRLDRSKKGTFDKVMKGWACLRKHGVEFNILCTVNAANERHGRAVIGKSAHAWSVEHFSNLIHCDSVKAAAEEGRKRQESV
jgi:uncharacterized protein